MFNIKKKSIKTAGLAIFLAIFAFYGMHAVWAGSITPENVIKLVNEARTVKGFSALEQNAKLSEAAQSKARDMLKNDYFSHKSPDGKDPWYFLEKAGYDYRYAGENLAMSFKTAEDEQAAWMESDTHRKNILNPNYQEIGVAVASGKINGKMTAITVQMFGSRADFMPVKKTVEENPVEKTSVVLGEDESAFARDPVAVRETVPAENYAGSGKQTAHVWAGWKNLAQKDWMAPLALSVLWVIMIGNIFFLAYSFYKKITLTIGKNEAAYGEKIEVEDLGEPEENESVPVRIHIQHLSI